MNQLMFTTYSEPFQLRVVVHDEYVSLFNVQAVESMFEALFQGSNLTVEQVDDLTYIVTRS